MTTPEQDSETDRILWEDALSDPKTKKALDEGLSDLAEGKVRRLEKAHEVFSDEVTRETTEDTTPPEE